MKLFNSFTGHSLHEQYRKLLVAPREHARAVLRPRRARVEHARAGRDARILAKMNSLEAPGVVRKLYEVSTAGVRIDLIVRGHLLAPPTG